MLVIKLNVRIIFDSHLCYFLLLTSAGHPNSTFDMLVSGHVQPATIIHSADILAEVTKILKPGATVCLREPTTTNGGHLRTSDKVQTALKLAGLINVLQVSQINNLVKLIINDSLEYKFI